MDKEKIEKTENILVNVIHDIAKYVKLLSPEDEDKKEKGDTKKIENKKEKD